MPSGVPGNTSTNGIGVAPPGGVAMWAASSWAPERGAVGAGGERRGDQLVVGHRVARADQAEPLEQRAEQLVVTARLADRGRDRRAVEQPHRAVAAADLAVLEERGRRQHDVGEPRGVGHHLVMDHDEQVVARQLVDHDALIRRGRGGVAVVDEQALEPGIAHACAARGRARSC